MLQYKKTELNVFRNIKCVSKGNLFFNWLHIYLKQMYTKLFSLATIIVKNVTTD